jgi:membrane protein implicated in regulation of membrane protease activity
MDFGKAVTICLASIVITAFLFGVFGVITFFAFSSFFQQLMTLTGVLFVLAAFTVVFVVVTGIIFLISHVGKTFRSRGEPEATEPEKKWVGD